MTAAGLLPGPLGVSLFDGSLAMPVAVVERGALRHNIATMADFCRDSGVALAPHSKTTMSPEILTAQMEEGCWGFTVATPAHLAVVRELGVERIVYANQVAEPRVARWIAAEQDADPAFTCHVLVDSVAGVALLDGSLSHGTRRPLSVLIEVGHAGGRAGVRDPAAVIAVAEAVAAAPSLRLGGVEAFEGLLGDAATDELDRVDALLARMVEAVRTLDIAGHFDDEILVTAGGSAYFDRVLHAWRAFDGDARVCRVLRSGCYVLHDGGYYARASPLDGRGDGRRRLRNALEVWGVVLSRPEPTLAVVGWGKRDVGTDVAPPRPHAVWRPAGGRAALAPGAAHVVRLSDQHGHLAIAADLELDVGDFVGCVVSHPCTTMDKWRRLLVVDDTDTVVDHVTTLF